MRSQKLEWDWRDGSIHFQWNTSVGLLESLSVNITNLFLLQLFLFVLLNESEREESTIEGC